MSPSRRGSAHGSAAALILALAFPSAGCGRGEQPADVAAAAGGEPAAAAVGESTEEASGSEAPPNQVEVTLYFLAADGEMLAPERRRIFRTASVTDRARQTVQALLDGPEGGLMRSVPPGTQLHEIFITPDGTAFIDLGSEFRLGIETGSSDAVFAVYSLVNTLASNFEEVERVKILVEGDEAGDVGGHLDLGRPILPEMSLVDRH